MPTTLSSDKPATAPRAPALTTIRPSAKRITWLSSLVSAATREADSSDSRRALKKSCRPVRASRQTLRSPPSPASAPAPAAPSHLRRPQPTTARWLDSRDIGWASSAAVPCRYAVALSASNFNKSLMAAVPLTSLRAGVPVPPRACYLRPMVYLPSISATQRCAKCLSLGTRRGLAVDKFPKRRFRPQQNCKTARYRDNNTSWDLKAHAVAHATLRNDCLVLND